MKEQRRLDAGRALFEADEAVADLDGLVPAAGEAVEVRRLAEHAEVARVLRHPLAEQIARLLDAAHVEQEIEEPEQEARSPEPAAVVRRRSRQATSSGAIERSSA